MCAANSISEQAKDSLRNMFAVEEIKKKLKIIRDVFHPELSFERFSLR